MEVATISHEKALTRQTVPGWMMVFFLVVIGFAVIGMACAVNTFGTIVGIDLLQTSLPDVWLDAAWNSIGIGGLAFAAVGTLAGLLDDSIGPFRSQATTFTAPPCVAVTWRVWIELRPPRSLS